jgi:hypothetical protein
VTGRPPVPERLLKVVAGNQRLFELNLKVCPFTPSPLPLQTIPSTATNLCGADQNSLRVSTMSVLPDNVLLEVFDFYRKNHDYTCHDVWKWHLLVHVCQRWRQVIFASPRHLNLQLLCTFGTPVRKNLSIWPPFPIAVEYVSYPQRGLTPSDEDNVIAALNHPNRVCYVNLYITSLQLGKMSTVIRETFPVLKYLHISLEDGNTPVLPANFLGGCAPCLQEITLSGIPCPALPTLLLSASHLVNLNLRYIPPTGCISPETLVVGLAALPRLECFILTFQSVTPSRASPDRTPPPLATRTVLPALTSFEFRGASEYLEDLVTRIDSPQLNNISIVYLDQPIYFQVDQLSKFISRSIGPHLPLLKHAQVTFFKERPGITIDMYPSSNDPFSHLAPARTRISCEVLDWRVLRLARVLRKLSVTTCNVVHLKIMTEPVSLDSTYNIEWTYDVGRTYDLEWFRLLRQFPTAKTLCVSWDLARHIASTLENSLISETTVAEALPSLDLVCLAGQPATSIEKFLMARQLSGPPVTVVNAESEFERRLESYVSE